MTTACTQNERQKYAQELAAHTLRQFTAACHSTDQTKSSRASPLKQRCKRKTVSKPPGPGTIET
ncbi:hypothetical protein AGABI1DRAFT_112355 [Agaricus bisporus var. burnettii JB137-S8]|uniref:Uncharacterized protein n=1 Tax=Agaricus bisporus var. burnettii (strain JB137-S8 / ATCC MYA-4627 / FGSC 10392) TaxID=597362 RepID=K5XBZ0_AGABU|nr:hypothetical protein AGABI2DRAFT_192320 [Agaricus bisporus var. bisporus H97]XP_007328250.1 uncharacterized protein AGABI1DRAFT_112355 [Agaricus bisporus var. burnettii JB137-S8]EKM80587.1 hypothetical protein AGABI1DRAFT_112355 [Agaricus bisporus var. burnettii JB137-S8]EKV47052.1 hypothetical protein AGABI2DRAFT_192320 [Agaricus bisporus var. bisporus H97]